MAKKSFLSLLFSFFVANFFVLNATNLENASTILTDTCEAPPPDSFRILDAGAHYVTLAWNPVDPMATYTIVVQKEGGNANTWENVDTISNVTGNSITIQNLLYGSKYQFELATNCENGDPSKFKIYAGPPLGVILDLVLDGRTPVNPVSVPPCSPILIQNYKWVGFKVESSQNLGSAINFFEFALGDDGVPQIMRVSYGPQIVATDFSGIFPIQPFPFTKVELPSSEFELRRVDGISPLIIGTIQLTYNPIQKTVQFCKKNGTNWVNSYSFSTIVANQVNGFENLNIVDRDSFDENCNVNNLVILNPMIDDQIFIENSNQLSCFKEVKFILIDMYSRVCDISKFNGVPNQLDLNGKNILPGFYTLVIELEGKKITKSILKI
ncbi:MAG: fibronectin type III domain-containing protein [Chitinophagales bacterium]|nr:fibronectin type III domain-containing protein [Chitinophagales bacterium]